MRCVRPHWPPNDAIGPCDLVATMAGDLEETGLRSAARDLLTPDSATRDHAAPPGPRKPEVAAAAMAPGADEPELRRRAKRFAVVLMVGSGLVMVAILGGIWLLVRNSL